MTYGVREVRRGPLPRRQRLAILLAVSLSASCLGTEGPTPRDEPSDTDDGPGGTGAAGRGGSGGTSMSAGGSGGARPGTAGSGGSAGAAGGSAGTAGSGGSAGTAGSGGSAGNAGGGGGGTAGSGGSGGADAGVDAAGVVDAARDTAADVRPVDAAPAPTFTELYDTYFKNVASSTVIGCRGVGGACHERAHENFICSTKSNCYMALRPRADSCEPEECPIVLILESGSMPKGSRNKKMSKADLDKVIRWIAAGAKNN